MTENTDTTTAEPTAEDYAAMAASASVEQVSETETSTDETNAGEETPYRDASKYRKRAQAAEAALAAAEEPPRGNGPLRG